MGFVVRPFTTETRSKSYFCNCADAAASELAEVELPPGA